MTVTERFTTQAPSTYCVFRRGSAWLALPALSVREALPCPPLVSVPRTPHIFAGLCHVRSEFVPVLRLDFVCTDGLNADEQILLVLEDSDGPWAMLVDEVSSLAALEFSNAPESSAMSPGSVIVGWAKHQDVVIQILDAVRLRELAERELSDVHTATGPTSPDAREGDMQSGQRRKGASSRAGLETLKDIAGTGT